MKPFPLSRVLPALLAASLALSASAFAQAAPGANPADMNANPTAPANPQASRATTRGQPGQSMEERVERRITNLHARLHITQAQEPQWQQFAQIMRDNARDMDRTFEQRSKKLASMSAADNMQSYAEISEQHAQDVQKLVPAFQALYNSMSDQQKQTADQLFRSYAERSAQRHGHHG